jgi:hypothetical protein
MVKAEFYHTANENAKFVISFGIKVDNDIQETNNFIFNSEIYYYKLCKEKITNLLILLKHD